MVQTTLEPHRQGGAGEEGQTTLEPSLRTGYLVRGGGEPVGSGLAMRRQPLLVPPTLPSHRQNLSAREKLFRKGRTLFKGDESPFKISDTPRRLGAILEPMTMKRYGRFEFARRGQGHNRSADFSRSDADG